MKSNGTLITVISGSWAIHPNAQHVRDAVLVVSSNSVTDPQKYFRAGEPDNAPEPKALRLRISAPDHDNKLDEIPPSHRCSAVMMCDLFGHVLPNFCQQFARAIRFRYIVVATGHSRLLSFTAERLRRDCDNRD